MDQASITVVAIAALASLGFTASFLAGWNFAIIHYVNKIKKQANYWRRLYIAKCTSYTLLKDAYAPRYDRAADRWRCPRTGEFVDDADIIPIIKDGADVNE